MTTFTYTVFVDDNFHHGDESERYRLGEFPTAAAAIEACKKIVDEFLEEGFKPGMSFQELYSGYTGFGEDPFIRTNDPGCSFSAWDYASARCAEMVRSSPGSAQEASMSRDTSGTSLRKELEAVYNAQIEALEKKDVEAFLASRYGAAAQADMIRARFSEMAEGLLEMTPRLDKADFVAVRTEGDDLAGYYFLLKEPPFASVQLAGFVKVDGRWRISPNSSTCSIEAEPDGDLLARAEKLVDAEPGLRLERPVPEEAGARAPAGSWDESIQAFLDCMAYDYEVRIVVNGVPLPFTGGESYSGRLFGIAAGAEPAPPAVLRAGENRIEVAYRFTGGGPGPGLTVTVRGPSGDPVYELAPPAGKSGQASATFRVPGPG
jgi:hypothetical protein